MGSYPVLSTEILVNCHFYTSVVEQIKQRRPSVIGVGSEFAR